MKKILFTLVLAIMTMAVPMEAQKKAATPKNDTVPQIEAYSDTTSLDSVAMDDEFWDDDDAWDRFFVYKSRKQKMRMMEMAMKSGKQIPVEAVGMPSQKGEDVWNKGVKQIFLGAGVGLLLWVIIGKLGMAIGVLITLIGIGNMAIGYGAKQKQKEQELHDRMFNKGSESRTSTQEPEHE